MLLALVLSQYKLTVDFLHSRPIFAQSHSYKSNGSDSSIQHQQQNAGYSDGVDYTVDGADNCIM